MADFSEYTIGNYSERRMIVSKRSVRKHQRCCAIYILDLSEDNSLAAHCDDDWSSYVREKSVFSTKETYTFLLMPSAEKINQRRRERFTGKNQTQRVNVMEGASHEVEDKFDMCTGK